MSIQEQLILVDEHDKQTGTAEKLLVHQQGLLHRAFSVIIYNAEGNVLLQKRASSKYHSANLWANSCCGHPRINETNKQGAKRRLFEELGFACDLTYVTELSYNLSLGVGMHEHEYTHVFAGTYNGSFTPNPKEVNGIKWVNPNDLPKMIKSNPESYSKWLILYIEQYFGTIFNSSLSLTTNQ